MTYLLTLGEDLNLFAVDDDGVPLHLNLAGKTAVGQVVDRDEFDILVLQACLENEAADAAEAVDRYAGRHGWHLSLSVLVFT